MDVFAFHGSFSMWKDVAGIAGKYFNLILIMSTVCCFGSFKLPFFGEESF